MQFLESFVLLKIFITNNNIYKENVGETIFTDKGMIHSFHSHALHDMLNIVNLFFVEILFSR